NVFMTVYRGDLGKKKKKKPMKKKIVFNVNTQQCQLSTTHKLRRPNLNCNFCKQINIVANLDEKADIMIAASDPQEYVPSGRQQALRHPGPLEHPMKRTPGIYSLSDPKTENSTFRAKLNPDYLEDELYVKGHTVIWSRGLVNNTDGLDNGRKTICCYTSPFPVHQAMWCTLFCERPIFDSNLIDLAESDSPKGKPMEAICISDSHNIRVFTPKGEDYAIAVPFSISKLWNTKYGIFIEKEGEGLLRDKLVETPATLFSLAFPLDDLCPVALCQLNNINILNNSNFKVIFTNNDPSLCMVYDMSTKQHSVFRIRKLKPDEKDFGDKVHSACYSTASISNKLKSRLSMWDNVVNSNNLVTPSPVHNKQPSTFTFFKNHSFVVAVNLLQFPPYESPWMANSSRINNSLLKRDKSSMISNKSYFDYSKTMSHLRSCPLICLEYLWTDNFSVKEVTTAGPASKVFLVDDLVGQWYLCYMLTSRCQLSIVKIDFSNPSNITFGLSTSVGAKDAVSISHLHMLGVLEHNGNITLYSGLTVVGKLHIGGTLTQHTPSPFIRRNMHSQFSPFPR
ncbi:hypothetical protein NQ318_004565, partial [Aromia moschata]